MNTNTVSVLSKAWAGMKPAVRKNAIGQTAIHLLLVLLAFRSVTRRPSAGVRGPRSLWMLVIPASIARIREDSAWVFPLGPFAYFILGRRSP